METDILEMLEEKLTINKQNQENTKSQWKENKENIKWTITYFLCMVIQTGLSITWLMMRHPLICILSSLKFPYEVKAFLQTKKKIKSCDYKQQLHGLLIEQNLLENAMAEAKKEQADAINIDTNAEYNIIRNLTIRTTLIQEYLSRPYVLQYHCQKGTLMTLGYKLEERKALEDIISEDQKVKSRGGL